MSTENTLETIINENSVQLDIKDDINTLEERHRLLQEAGFIAKAQNVMVKVIMKRVLATLKNPIIVLRPSFTSQYFLHLGHFDVVLLKEYRKPKGGIFGGTKIVDGLYLVETDLERFKAHVPDAMLPAVIKGKNLGLKLKVWFVTKKSQILNYVAQNVHMDPVVVGYPIVGQGNEGRGSFPIWDNTHAIVLAMWGKDIENISKYFEERR